MKSFDYNTAAHHMNTFGYQIEKNLKLLNMEYPLNTDPHS